MIKRNGVTSVVLLTFATALTALGVYFFKIPNHFSTGGVSGMGIILGAVTPEISASTYTAALNLFFVFLGFIFLGKGFGWRTIYCSILFSVILQALEWFVPLQAPLTDQKMLELLFAAILPAAGSALVFNLDGSTGGTDVLALILKKFTSLDTGKALLCADIIFVFATFFVFDIEAGLYSVLGLVCKSTIVDVVLEVLHQRKAMMIVTEYPDNLLDHIIDDIHRGATVWEATGAYSDRTIWVVLTVVNRAQSIRIRGFLREEDPEAFILTENTSEIYGKGFMRA